MKKVFLILSICGIILGLSSCVYIGLSKNALKKHNEKIKEQMANFSYDSYTVEFYHYPNEEKTVSMNCVDGKLEYLLVEKERIDYATQTEGISYNFLTKEETTFSIDIMSTSYYADALELISTIKNYENLSGKTSGRKAIYEDEEDVLDEVTHYFYHMEDWEYLDNAELDFYVTSKDSILKNIWFTDCSNNYQLDKRHFTMNIYLNSYVNPSNLKESYENYVKMYEENDKKEK